MITPIVHLNGTSIKELTQATKEALDALREVKAKMVGTRPHPRDFPNNTSLYELALEHQKTAEGVVGDLIISYSVVYSDLLDIQ